MKFKVLGSKAHYDLTLDNKASSGRWVNYGPANSVPQQLIELHNKSGIHRAIVKAKVRGVKGRGFLTKDPNLQNWLDNISAEYGANELLGRLALDYVLFGGVAVEAIWDSAHVVKQANKLAQVNHQDFSRIRSGKRGMGGKPEFYFYADDWSTRKNLIRYNGFDPMLAADEPRQLLYHFNYEPGQDYYPLPDYIAGATDIETDIALAQFRLGNTKNSFLPGAIVTVHSQMSPEEQDQFERGLEQKFSGTHNAGRFIVAYADAQSEPTTVEPLQNFQNDGIFEKTDALVKQAILTAHGLSSPVLAGIPGTGGLGGNANEIQMAAKYFDFTVIDSMRTDLERLFNRLARYAGFPNPDLTIQANELDLLNQAAAENTDVAA